MSDVDLYVAAMVLTNPSGIMVKPQRAVAAVGRGREHGALWRLAELTGLLLLLLLLLL